MEPLLITPCHKGNRVRVTGLLVILSVSACFIISGPSLPAQQPYKDQIKPDLADFLYVGEYYVKPFPAQKDAKTGFVVGDKNNTALIKVLKGLNGRKIADLDKDLRPGAKSKVGSEKGFLGPDKSQLDVLTADNQYAVEELGLSHQEVAKHLHAMGTIGFSQMKHKEDGAEFIYCGRRFKLELHLSRGYQLSPFMDGTKTETYLEVVNVNNGKKQGYFLLVPFMLERYGFYEGKGTPYRVEPSVILEVFDFLKPGKAPAPTAALLGEISAPGKRLAAALDEMDVEHFWLSKHYVNWETGITLDKPVADSKPHTHCSAFAAAACKRLGIYLLRPPEHGAANLANAQADWLTAKGAEQGWKEVKSPVEAQRLANAGYLVLASFKEKEPNRSGHIAIVRPSTRDRQAVEGEGPAIIQAGMHNFQSTTLKAGFGSHPSAWRDRQIRFFAHEIKEQGR